MAENGGLVGRTVNSVVGAVVPPVVDSIDIQALVDDVDLNELIARIDMDALLENVDVSLLVSRIDINALVKEIDLDSVLENVDLNALLDQVDLDALLDKIDLEALMRKAKIGEIVADSTGQVAGSALDLVRRPVVGLDVIIMRFINGLMRRQAEDLPIGPPLLNPDEPAVGDGIEDGPPAAAVREEVAP